MDAKTFNLADPGRSAWIAPFFAVVFGMLMLQMSNLGFSPLLPDIQSTFKITYGQLGLFTGIYGLVGIALSVPAGLLARRHGEKAVLLIGLLVVAAGLATLALAPDFAVALTGRALWLAGYRLAFVCVMMAVALTAPAKLKGSTMGIVGAVSAFASVIGAPFGSEIGKALGWRSGIWGYAGLAVIGATVFAVLYKRDPGAEAPAPHGPSPVRGGSRPAHKTPVVWVMAAGIGLLNMGGFTITFFVPSVAKGIFHLGSTDAALMISSAYFVAIFGNLLCGYLADRVDRINLLIGISCLLVLAAPALNSTNLLIFRIAVIAVVALGHAATNQGYATVGAVLKGRETGTAMGIVSLGSGVYAYMGPQMLGLLRDWTGGFSAGFWMLAGASLVGVVLLLALKVIEKRRAATLAAVERA
jgi:predicted MFS family arabinose efflux permease